jgi:hypothetical protein
MSSLFRNRKALASISAALLCTVFALFVLAYPRPVSHPVLGGGWECSRTAFLTSCTRTNRSAPVANGLRTAPIVFWWT